MMTPESGDLRLLNTATARELLQSCAPAHLAYVKADGTPRIHASWFVWTGELLALPICMPVPDISLAVERVRALKANPDVAVSIDSDTFPAEVLMLRGSVEFSEFEGVSQEYMAATVRYLGGRAARAHLVRIDRFEARTININLRPTWAGMLGFDSPVPSSPVLSASA